MIVCADDLISQAGTSYYTPLQYAAKIDATGKLVEDLISLGCSVTNSGSLCATPLHIASRSGNASAVRVLLSHAAPVDAVDARGLTPIDVAANDDIRRALQTAAALSSPGADWVAVDCMVYRVMDFRLTHSSPAPVYRSPSEDRTCDACTAPIYE